VRTALAVAEDRAGPRDAPAAVDALWAALHHGLTADSTEESVVGAVNRGGAANVHGALAGAIAGAARGRRSLPDRWLDHLSVGPLRDLARRLEAGAFDGPRGRS
jgi:ADP-ribosyl-[dinitrogen reductase] hydrolase